VLQSYQTIQSNQYCPRHNGLIPDESKYLLQACINLEAGLEKSNHNFQFKLLLIRIYLLLGIIPVLRTTYPQAQSPWQ